MSTDKKPLDPTLVNLINQSRRKCIAQFPYMSASLRSLRQIISDDVTSGGKPTMGVTKSGFLFISPDYLKKVLANTPNEAEAAQHVAFVLAHETLHMVLRHHDRMSAIIGADPDSPQYRYGDLWKCANLAADVALNPLLKGAGLKMAESPEIAGVWPETFKLPPGLTMEGYYRLLVEKAKQARKDCPKHGDKAQSGKQEGQDSSGSEGDEQDQQQDKDGSGGKGGHQHGDGGAQCTCGGDSFDPDDYNNPAGGSCGSGGGAELDNEDKLTEGMEKWGEAARERMARKFQQDVQSARERGSIPAGLEAELDAALEPAKVPWQEVLRRQVEHAIEHRPGADTHLWTQPSRRQAALGYGVGVAVLPGLCEPVVRCAILRDTSGSMSGVIAQTLGEIEGIVQACGAEVLLVDCDTQVHSARQVSGGVQANQVYGGGGTDMKAGLERCAEDQPDVIVCLTDAYIGSPGPGVGIPVIWANFTDYDADILPSVEAGWGTIVRVELE